MNTVEIIALGAVALSLVIWFVMMIGECRRESERPKESKNASMAGWWWGC